MGACAATLHSGVPAVGDEATQVLCPATRFQIAMRRVITHGMNKPVASHLIRQLQVRGARIKEKDIAAV